MGVLAGALALATMGPWQTVRHMLQDDVDVRHAGARALATRLEAAPGAVILGGPDASVMVTVFTDFACPACRRFAEQVLPTIEHEMVALGRARVQIIPFPLTERHPASALAAQASLCAAAAGRYRTMHDALYESSPQWVASADSLETLVRVGRTAGLDPVTLRACLAGDSLRAVVWQARMQADALDLPGTPTVFVDGTRVPSPSMRRLRRAIVSAERQRRAAGHP